MGSHLSESKQGCVSVEELQLALRESEDRYNRIFRSSPDAISLTELGASTYLDINEGFTRIFGFARDELIGRRATEIGIWAYPKDREGLAAVIREKRSVRDYLAVGRCKDGSLRTCSLSGEVTEWSGRPALILVVRDITEQLYTERALREALARYTHAFRSSPDALFISALETGQVLEANDNFIALYGASRDEVIGKTTLELGLYAMADERKSLVDRLLNEGSIAEHELLLRRKNGEERNALLFAEPLEMEGKMVIAVTLRDITERRKAEYERAILEAQLRQAQKLEALGTLAGGIAHDFNNILTAIIANAELAEMSLDSAEEIQMSLSEIKKAGTRARDLVRQILAFSRIKKEDFNPVVIASVIHEAVSLLRSSIPATIRIEMEGLDDTSLFVLGAPSQLHQVVMNLGTNATHAMKAAGGVLSFKLRALAADDETAPGARPARVCLEVSDTGHGMSETVLARLFEPFFTTKPQGEGTGLGLSVVLGIVQTHGGTIDVVSKVGHGTTFTVTLPLYVGAVNKPSEPEVVVPTTGRGESILFIDDEAQICQFAQRLLVKLGYSVRTCTNPLDVLEILVPGQCDCDLVITDLTMPHMTGLDVARRVQGMRADIPVLLCSGLPGSWTPERLHELGISALLTKPLTAQVLAKEIRRLLDERVAHKTTTLTK